MFDATRVPALGPTRDLLLGTCLSGAAGLVAAAAMAACGVGGFDPLRAIVGALGGDALVRFSGATARLVRIAALLAVRGLAMAGAAMAVVVLAASGDAPAFSALTLGEVATAARGAAPVLLMLWGLTLAAGWCWRGCPPWTTPSASSLGGLSLAAAPKGWREATARHEAAHALVAHVLGVPYVDVQVNRHLDASGGAGGLRAPPAEAACAPDDLYGRTARKIAMLLAGRVGELGGGADLACVAHERSKDWVQASTLAWAMADAAPGRPLLESLFAALSRDLAAPEWDAAIRDGARALLDAGGEAVPAAVFASVAARHALALPRVVDAARSGGPMETAAA